ncbi:periplasmic sensor signal transduction histidine kinase [Patulibacter medicamentivorans]|uniref:histidine kinase n=1 Tax=Patulibacter medicamentivorans TaxID=1097667 RepID=H0EBS4_9ACTN|nr:HAMP domain-containing sensor histidine kinase [Patulibacter medicamentivorans]EHN08872.1 periplasmic sensor signal transduction histidine kinase [Patulibacter medicamentivorans]
MILGNLRSRLTFGVVAVLAIVLALGGAVVAREADRSERQSLDDRLRRTAELLDTVVGDAITKSLPEKDARLNQVLRATGSSLVLWVGGEDVVKAGIPLPARSSPAPLGFSTRQVGERRLRTFAKTFTSADGDALGVRAIQEASSDLRPLERRQGSLERRLLLIGLAMLLLAGLGTWFAADLVLRPLRRLRTATHRIEGDGDLERRVPVDGPGELRSLAGSFNAMLERLGRSAQERNRALEATRRFAADVGHELRTPLTSVQATLSAIDRHPDVDPEVRQMIVGEALAEQRRLVGLLDGLQALARGDANPVDDADVDLAAVAAEAARAFGDRHPEIDLSVRLPDAAVPVRGWEPGLRLIVDNLLQNAARHGRPEGQVRLSVTEASPDVGPRLVVADDGPGIAAEERERIFEPFVRGSGVDRPGSGLGLALVAQQVGHHGASVTIDDASIGGARVTVRFRAT